MKKLSTVDERLLTLEETIDSLERFKGSVSRYVEWWTRMNMEMEQQANSTDEVKKLHSEVRKQNIARKWENLGLHFQKYTDKVEGPEALNLCVMNHMLTLFPLRCTSFKTNIQICFYEGQFLDGSWKKFNSRFRIQASKMVMKDMPVLLRLGTQALKTVFLFPELLRHERG